ncbi:PAS domain S-box [Terriglobus roseus DSM 18391]|uniref:histidine kinase n=1 Tax=Terriglobus roseus (strain DSM 18391 / NRRL B-41598 / KBS 63) TaxID=926566 RepID=I3ZG86_TERRK|nr:ATP-binding protein [Terriglobus roseus]AFL88254.1 PAS domain S-box [Terriglobus roseus DSM 18391]AFL88595.1 PAS domain S-box [Terriglobus roseus DSM 18391]
MGKALQTRVTAVVLAIVTLLVCALGIANFLQESSYEAPTDGVWWIEGTGGLLAERVPANSPAHRAGVREGDLLVTANKRNTLAAPALQREMGHTGTWGHINYSLMRGKAPLEVPVILEPTDRSRNQGLRLIALAYLAIGMYVLLRRWTAPKAMHFYVFCLVSGVLYSFRYTGVFDTLDWICYWGVLAAGALQPALFLHFAVSFGDMTQSLRRKALVALIYIPGAVEFGLQIEAITRWSATERLKHRLDQIGVGYLALYYVIAAVVFWFRYRASDKPLERQQLKWLTRGTQLSVIPFTALYAIPYLADADVPVALARAAGFALIFLPLTFAWAIVRYRLMDTDLIFKRGVTYTLATAALIGVYFGVVALSAEVVHTRLPSLRIWGLLAGIIATALIFEPIKAAIQARVDRLFDRKRYDYRETLIEFSRGLSSQTDLPTLSRSIVERLSQTLLVSRVAVFVASDDGTGRDFSLAASHGLPDNILVDLPTQTSRDSFLNFGLLSQDHIFFENPQQLLHLEPAEQRMASLLDLNYYLPCRVSRQGHASRTIAVIGLGRTQEGDFLSSEDMELLSSLAGYIGIAIQNAQLFSRLEQQITEFERLKEFNENIVESIKVGIFTLDLNNAVESWNAEMEVMYALPRADAIGRNVAELFPSTFLEPFFEAHNQPGTHHLSKVRLDLRTGESRTANIAIAPLLTRDFVSVGSIVMMEDITDRTRLEGQLTQAEKLSSIGLLAAGVAHEVNTPLAVISSYAQMLQKHTRDDLRLAPILEKITQQTFRASEIVNGLLNFSRTSSTVFASLDLNAVLRETLTLIDHQLRTARVTVDADLQATLPRIYGSQGKLQQVILNLLLNAKDAMNDGAGGTIRLVTYDNGNDVTLRISDTGSGIDPEHLHRIYDPFFTTKNAPRQGQHKGTGLGLSVSYGIVQEHNGRIAVESTVGVGTTFTLDFPIEPSPKDDPSAQREPSKSQAIDPIEARTVNA